MPPREFAKNWNRSMEHRTILFVEIDSLYVNGMKNSFLENKDFLGGYTTVEQKISDRLFLELQKKIKKNYLVKSDFLELNSDDFLYIPYLLEGWVHKPRLDTFKIISQKGFIRNNYNADLYLIFSNTHIEFGKHENINVLSFTSNYVIWDNINDTQLFFGKVASISRTVPFSFITTNFQSLNILDEDNLNECIEKAVFQILFRLDM